WILSKSSIVVFIVTAGGVETETIRLPEDCKDFWAGLHDMDRWIGHACGERDHALDTFSDILFAPLMPRLRGLRGLYLVPHRHLHFTPMHACRDENGDSLGARLSIAYLPSAGFLPQLPPPSADGPILSLANPEKGTLRTLPFAEREAQVL